MTQIQNQFEQSTEKGKQDLFFNSNTLPCEIHSTETATLVPGQAVKLYDSAGGVPKVVKIAADTDKIFGIIPYIVKKSSFVAGDRLEVASESNVIVMEASAAIARGAQVMPVVAGSKVATATAGKTIMGFAYDKAADAGDLIRVYLLPYVNSAISGTAADTVAILPTVDLTALVVAPTTFAPSAITTFSADHTTAAEFDTEMDVELAFIKTALDLKTDNVDAETLRTETEARLGAIETKLDGIRTSLQVAGLMS